MLVSVYCIDAEGASGPRQSQLQAHFDHIAEIKHKIKVAGPIVAEDGKTPIASLLVFDVASPAEAEALMRRDPYYQAGVWRELKIQRFRGVVGAWMGDEAIL